MTYAPYQDANIQQLMEEVYALESLICEEACQLAPDPSRTESIDSLAYSSEFVAC
jgi:hypothetical protein